MNILKDWLELEFKADIMQILIIMNTYIFCGKNELLVNILNNSKSQFKMFISESRKGQWTDIFAGGKEIHTHTYTQTEREKTKKSE